MKKIKDINWWVWIGFICLVFFLTMQSVNSPISRNYAFSDYSVYQYVASIMCEGGMPYRDTFDHKGPVFYLINALGYVIHPKYGMWMIDFLLMFGTAVYAYKLSHKVLNAKMSFFITVVALSGISAWGYWIGDTPESVILFFLMLIMYLFVEYIDCQSLTSKQLLAVGFSCAIAFLMKPTFLAMAAVLILEILYEVIKRKNYIFLKKCLILFSVPFFGLIVGTVAWLTINGALTECIDQYLIFNAKYSSVKRGIADSLNALYVFVEKPTTLFGLFCIWINFMRWNEYTDKDRRLLLSTYLAWALVFYVSVMPGRAYQQYTVVFYPMLVVIVTFAFKDIERLFQGDRYKRVVGMMVLILVTFNIFLPNARETVANIRNYTAETGAKVQVVNYFNDSPGEYEISVVSPDDTWVYLQTGHHSATKYAYTQADLIYENVKTDFIKEYSRQINEKRPRFIVESCRSNLYTNKIVGSIANKYDEVFRNDGYAIYELNGN
ncbi:MAG: glycosyltransferase family 39 protein [Lachnospiraceae bacterium]|nr:glycosyltransferase family 39 protein [Lachnospiraceae bacterium]